MQGDRVTEQEPVPILLVDDRRENLLALESLLEPLGHRLITAESGREALKLLLREEVALILLDVSMPEIDGYAVAELVRARERNRDTPIIFLTANLKTSAHVFKGYAVGAVDYIFKPLVPEVLLSKVSTFVDLYNRSRALKRQAEDLRRAHAALDVRVKERTEELAQINQRLKAEIVERRRAEAERALLLDREQAARREAERVNRTKDEFLATLSHELRTPLNAILGWAHILESRQVDAPTLERALRVIRNNAFAQKQLIEDILDVSRIINGKMTLHITPVDMRRVVEAALDTVRPAADAKRIHIIAELAAVDPTAGDQDRLQQVVWNLLSNAIKFTPKEGEVRVTLERVENDVRLTVADNGRGIPTEFLPHIFDRFSQADSSVTRAHGGLGLGMAIVRHLVELHGGTVSADSGGEDQGSTFAVVLPVRELTRMAENPPVVPRVGAPEESWQDLPRLDGVNVLLVDNEADARQVAAAILRQQGAVVEEVSSADEAITWLGRRRADLIVSDIAMPGVDGYEFMHRVRQRAAAEGGLVPAIALTACATFDDANAALAAGYHRHIAKPISPSSLVRAAAELTALPRTVTLQR